MLIADTNEFHELADGDQYKNSREPDGTNHPVIIMRATYSITHIDLAYARSMKRAREAGLHVGHYAYMVANVDAAAQGHFFAHVVAATRGFNVGDSIWCDDEEGSGNQSPRVQAFLKAAHDALQSVPKEAEGAYSGAAFWQAHLGSLPTGVNRWVAAYGQSDPHLPSEDLWQFTDNQNVPGVAGPCDASIYKGTLSQFLSMIGATPSKPKTRLLEDNMQSLAPASRLAYPFDDEAKTIRFVTDAPAGSEVPGHIAWYTADSNSHFKLVVGSTIEVGIPGGRGAMIHRDDAPGDPTAQYQFNFITST